MGIKNDVQKKKKILWKKNTLKNTKVKVNLMNGLTIMIGQLGLVWLTNNKGKKHVNKQISRQFINKISIIVC